MKKKLTIIFLIGMISYFLYFFIPRSVVFEYVMEFPKPNEEFDYSYFIGFNYVHNEKDLIYGMVDCFKGFNNIKSYDSEYIKNISKQLDYKKFDYIVTWQKELNALHYSPYLSKRKDGLSYLNEIPLIPTYDTVITDKVYIYCIKKNNKFRAPGP